MHVCCACIWFTIKFTIILILMKKMKNIYYFSIPVPIMWLQILDLTQKQPQFL